MEVATVATITVMSEVTWTAMENPPPLQKSNTKLQLVLEIN